MKYIIIYLTCHRKDFGNNPTGFTMSRYIRASSDPNVSGVRRGALFGAYLDGCDKGGASVTRANIKD